MRFTTRHIPWTQIKTIKPGSMGLMIVKKEGVYQTRHGPYRRAGAPGG